MNSRKIKWGKPYHPKVGKTEIINENVLARDSKCGRYRIIRRTYQIPISSVGYSLYINGNAKRHNCFDTLLDAKLEAESHNDPYFWEKLEKHESANR